VRGLTNAEFELLSAARLDRVTEVPMVLENQVAELSLVARGLIEEADGMMVATPLGHLAWRVECAFRGFRGFPEAAPPQK
jgi:hypothetical protein